MGGGRVSGGGRLASVALFFSLGSVTIGAGHTSWNVASASTAAASAGTSRLQEG